MASILDREPMTPEDLPCSEIIGRKRSHTFLNPGTNIASGPSGKKTTVACQTALSYASQDTLVPVTALLQLFNKSMITVMANVGM